MRTSIMCTTILLAAFGAAVPLVVLAADGALEINQDCVAGGCFTGDAAGFPVTITQQGHYVLTSDLLVTGDPGQTFGIQVQATPVDLDLGGFTIDGGGTCTGNPVTACSGALAARGIQVPSSGRLVRIHDGTVLGFANDGIAMFSVQDGTLIQDVTTSENGGVGIFASGVASASIRLHRVASTRNFASGVFNQTNGRLIVDESVISNNGQTGATVSLARGVFVNSKFLSNGDSGVFCTGLCALGQSVFLDNNTASTSAEFNIATLRDMGGNVCDDGTCP